jgi:hypothetical protein
MKVTVEKSKFLIQAWAVFLCLLFSTLCYSYSTPFSAGVDETQQAASAWFTFENFQTPKTMMQNSGELPKSLQTNPSCFQFKPEVSAKCLNSQESLNNSLESYPMVNYSPVYMFFVGAGMHFFNLVSSDYVFLGGRLASIVLNLMVVLLALIIGQRNNVFKPKIFLMILTPMSLFLFATINPSGWEISTGILFTTLLIKIFKVIRKARQASTLQYLGLFSSALIFVTARPISILWFIIIFLLVAAVNLPQKNDLKVFNKLAITFVSPIVLALTYLKYRPYEMPSAPGFVPAGTPDFQMYFTYFFESIKYGPKNIQQMYGVLGWLDTPAPRFLLAIYLIAFLIFIFEMKQRSLKDSIGILCGLIVLFVLSFAIEAFGWNNWPAWWQGRYLLPLTICFLIINLSNKSTGKDLGKDVNFLLFTAFILNGFMIFVNYVRYESGVRSHIPFDGSLLTSQDYTTISVFVLIYILLGFYLHHGFKKEFTESSIGPYLHKTSKLAIVILLIPLLSIESRSVYKQIQFEKSLIVQTGPASEIVGEIISGTEIKQYFESTARKITHFELQFATFNRKNVCEINVNLTNLTNGELRKFNLSASKLKDNAYKKFSFAPLNNTGQAISRYEISVYSKGCSSGNAVTLWADSKTDIDNYVLNLNGEDVKKVLVMKLYGQKDEKD